MKMAKALKHIDISNRPELLQIVQEAALANQPVVFDRANTVVAVLRPVKRSIKQRIPRGKPFTKDDSLFNLIGIAKGQDDGIHDVSENVDKYLADAYAPTHE